MGHPRERMVAGWHTCDRAVNMNRAPRPKRQETSALPAPCRSRRPQKPPVRRLHLSSQKTLPYSRSDLILPFRWSLVKSDKSHCYTASTGCVKGERMATISFGGEPRQLRQKIGLTHAADRLPNRCFERLHLRAGERPEAMRSRPIGGDAGPCPRSEVSTSPGRRPALREQRR